MNGPDYMTRPQPWSWFIQDDPNPELVEQARAWYRSGGQWIPSDGDTTFLDDPYQKATP